MRELDHVLRLSDLAAAELRDTRHGKNTLCRLDGLFWQSVFGRLTGYEDVNDADQLTLDPVKLNQSGRTSPSASLKPISVGPEHGRFAV